MRAAALASSAGAPISQAVLIGALNESARPGDTIIAAAGGPPGDLQKVWDATGERHCHLEFGFSCMGYELPATLGVRLAQGEHGEVIALIGDGTFLMQPTELATAAQEGLKVTVVVSDNHGYQVIRRLQMHATGRHFGNEMRYRVGSLGAGPLEGDYVRLDLVSVARGLGATVFAAETRDEVLEALARARETDGPVVIVVPTAPHENLPASGVWWDVAPAAQSSQPWLEEKREAYQAGLATQRWHG